MKFKFAVLMLAIFFIFPGCLTFRSINHHIIFNENFTMGKIRITFEDLRSMEFRFFDKDKDENLSKEEAIKQQKEDDFEELVKLYQEDDLLLDEVQKGIYVKERQLYEKNNVLYGSYSGIFNKLNFDEGEYLKILKDEIVLNLKADDDVRKIETNGSLDQTDDNVLIFWPKSEHEIYWKLIMKEDKGDTNNVYPLIDLYHKWKENPSGL